MAQIRGTNRADTLEGSSGADLIQGLDGNDRLEGRGGADRLVGGAGTDVLLGGGGNDTLNGGNGSDNLTGGSGADTFVISDPGNTDFLEDFSRAEGDKVDVSAFGITADDITFDRDEVGTFANIDTNGDGATDTVLFSTANLGLPDFIF